MAPGYRPGEIESRWQEAWQKAEVFLIEDTPTRPKWFVMDLPPFANGSLHLGHVRNYAIADASARFHRQLGHSVNYTTGFDNFGLPSEAAAAAAGCHPKALTDAVIERMKGQFTRLGLSYDVTRITDYGIPAYYKWVQWVFVKLWQGGYVHRDSLEVNWCARCAASVEDGLLTDAGGCWRCGDRVESRTLEQWFIRETEFADEVLDTLDALDRWPKQVKEVQRRYVGRASGVEVTLDLDDGGTLDVFEQRPELLASAAYVAVSRGHPLSAPASGAPAVSAEAETGERPESRRAAYSEATVVPLGVTARNPVSGAAMPVVQLHPWVHRYGDAMLLVPGAHALVPVVAERLGVPVPEAAGGDAADGDALIAAGRARPVVRHAMRDWHFSRERYWGAPVPAVHCERCGPVPVPEDELPVLLPMDVETGTTDNPLTRHEAFLRTTCPACGGPATRDTDTLGAYSSPWWYMWHGMPPGADDPFGHPGARAWQPVDVMVGGTDQATTCFFHMRPNARMLVRLGIVEHEEPVRELVAIGMLQQGGVKMSKSGANAVGVDDLVAEHGADALRLAVLGAAAPGNAFEWDPASIRRQRAWLSRLWDFATEVADLLPAAPDDEAEAPAKARRKLAQAVDVAAGKVTSAMHRHAYHLAVDNVETLLDRLAQHRKAAAAGGTLPAADVRAIVAGLRVLVQLLGPLAPHVAEELWSALGGETMLAAGGWPRAGS